MIRNFKHPRQKPNDATNVTFTVSCGIGPWGGQRPDLGRCVTVTGTTDGAIAAGEGHVPSLRERKPNIALLAAYFVEKFSRVHGKKVKRISQHERAAAAVAPAHGVRPPAA